jgi:hypothetical protein
MIEKRVTVNKRFYLEQCQLQHFGSSLEHVIQHGCEDQPPCFGSWLLTKYCETLQVAVESYAGRCNQINVTDFFIFFEVSYHDGIMVCTLLLVCS